MRLWDIDDDDLQKISQCNNLKVLQISGENITNLTTLQNLVLLEELHIRSEELEELMPISGLTQLRVLSVVSSLYELSNLKVLALSNNPISQEQFHKSK